MFPVPPPAALPGQKEVKPVLQGVRNKQRKGVQKANAKFEPEAFRDNLVKHLESVPEGDFEAVAQKLDALGNQLDYRKYEQELFEILLVGGLLAPGGGFLDVAPKSSFSILASAKEPVEVGDVKKIVEVFNKLMRRYKYLQKPFEETALRGTLQYINKFSPVEQEKLAVATAFFVANGLVSASVLLSVVKDHLVKDSTSLTFLTKFLQSYLSAESLEHLSVSLRKGGVTNLEAFFPAGKNNSAGLSAHFKGTGLGGVVDFYLKQKSSKARDEIAAALKDMVADDADEDEILSFLEQKHKAGDVPEPEFIAIVWNGLLRSLDMTRPAGNINEYVVKEIERIAPTLAPFCEKPTVEVALINTIQIWAYENTKIMGAFPRILKTLYMSDVLSDQSIIYWHSKGAKPQAKQAFLDATQPLVDHLKQQESDEESDDDE